MGSTIKNLWKYLSDFKGKIFFVVFLVILSTVSAVLGPLVMGMIIDNGIIKKDIEFIISMLVILSIIYLFNSVTSWASNYIMTMVSQNAVKKLRRDTFNKVESLPLNYFDTRPLGDIMSRITNDIDQITNSLSQTFIQFVSGILMIVGVLFAMFSLNWALALCISMSIPLILLIVILISASVKTSFTNQQKSLGKLNGVIKEGVKGQNVLRIFGAEETYDKRFSNSNQELTKNTIVAQAGSNSITALMTLINNLAFNLVVLLGAYLVLEDYITIGLVTAFINYARQFTQPVSQLAGQYTIIQQAIASTNRVFEILNEESEEDINDIDTSYRVKGDVKFEHVSFSYDKKTPILQDISFELAPGKSMAIVGPTGSGKTTIINLVTRFYDIDQGNIYIDGKPIFDIQKNALRSRLGIVLQNNYIFDGTIKDNILYGKSDATDEEIKEAARMANAHKFIEKMPQGYETPVGKGGGILSEGQRQLLSIARTILSNPDLLILDEATSSIDTRTELVVQNALSKLMESRTSFVIAHRLKTIKNSDTILVVKDGHKIEQGSHNELMDQKGFYYDMYTKQMKTQ